MNKQNAAHGYILILTLMITALSMTMVTYMFIKGQLHMSFMRTMIDREKARALAASGIQIAMSQLTQFEELEPKKEEAQKEKPNSDRLAKELLERVLPALNRWQQFVLKEKVDGIDGEVHICIMSEEGKIPINQIYDFDKKKFKGEGQPKGDMKKVMQVVCERLQKAMGQQDLFGALEKFLKERHSKLNDVTELLTDKSFSFFRRNVFYEPPSFGKKEKEKKRSLYLTDLFTTWSDKQTIQPWLFSDSLCGLFGCKRAEPGDVNNRQNMVKECLKGFKCKTNWSTDWSKFLQPLYGREFTSLPKGIDAILNPMFKPNMFSVLVYATVNGITQRAYAIVRRSTRTAKDKSVSYSSNIKRIYWL